MKVQVPSARVVVLPSAVLPSITVTTLPGAAVPLSVGVASRVVPPEPMKTVPSVAPVIRGAAGGAVQQDAGPCRAAC